MKFFFKICCKHKRIPKTVLKRPNLFLKTKGNFTINNVDAFSRFFFKKGYLIKYKNVFSTVLKNLNFFFYQKNDFFLKTYPNISWILNNFLEKNLNYTHIFNMTTNLIKPPFIIKSILVPKKLKKKTKQKYLVKIVYRDENKRIKNSFKQIQYFSKKFDNNRFDVRLYKSLLFTFLEWKDSYLFKLKLVIFKKFFKF